MSRRFLPKRRASIDQAPGPRTAIAAPMVAKRMLLRRWAVPERATQILVTARSDPAIGVQKPASKKIAALAAIICSATDPCGAAPISLTMPS